MRRQVGRITNTEGVALTATAMNASYARQFNFGVGRILCLVFCVAILAGCATAAGGGDVLGKAAAQQAPCVPAEMVNLNEMDTKNYVIKAGDELHLGFYLSSEFDRDVTVRPDGKISLELVGDVRASGLTPQELASRLDQAYLRELRNPGVTVHVKSSPSRRIYVQGQVAHAGAVALQPGMTALQAIAEAGGVTETSAADSTVLIRRDACGVPQGIIVDLGSADGGAKKVDDVALLPADILVVPRSHIANVNLFVKQYIQGLLPIQPYAPLPL